MIELVLVGVIPTRVRIGPVAMIGSSLLIVDALHLEEDRFIEPVLIRLSVIDEVLSIVVDDHHYRVQEGFYGCRLQEAYRRGR